MWRPAESKRYEPESEDVAALVVAGVEGVFSLDGAGGVLVASLGAGEGLPFELSDVAPSDSLAGVVGASPSVALVELPFRLSVL